MGGRGTFASGNPVNYTYKTVGYIEGVKVLEGTNGKHSLPNGTFHEMRIYDKDHTLVMEIAYHPEKTLTGDGRTPVLHYHLYDERFSKNKAGAFDRTDAHYLTDKNEEKIQKIF